MKTNQNYNYEKFMISLDHVLDLITEAIENHNPLSLGRFGHIEVAYIGWSYFPHWTNLLEPYSAYSGANAPISTIKDELTQALRNTDIVGFHASWGEAWEDKETAKLTSELVQRIDFRPKHVCSAFITHDMIKSDRFWNCIKGHKVALVGRRAEEAMATFKEKGINVTHTTTLEGYEEIEKVYEDLSTREDWDIALISAGIPATILGPRLAKQTNRVVVDFGHALDKLVDGENFNYKKILKDWKEGTDHKMLISMVMAVFNGEAFLRESIDSALSQTYANMELIIVNDGSTDSTFTILNEIDNPKVKVIHLEKNQGAANALNIGIREAKGSWIAIQDADDNSYPTRIEEQVKYIHGHPQLVGVGSFIECIPGIPNVSEGMLIGVAKNKNWFTSREKVREKIYWGCPLTHSSVIFSKDAFWKVGGYNPNFKIAYDYDLWLKLLEKGEMENVPKVLLKYRIHNKSLSNKDGIATVNEIQIASSKAIARLFSREKPHKPRVIVVGPQAACKNFDKHIAPVSGLNVETLIDESRERKVNNEAKRLKQGKIDAIIVLDGVRQEKILSELKRKGFKLNAQVFNIYNILR